MNNPFFLTIFIAFLLAALGVSSQTKTAASGQWSASNTWTPAGAPSNGDTLIIPDGVTVTVNCNCGTYSDMEVNIFGQINFPGGRKINLSSNGSVNVFGGGLVTGSNNGDKLSIGGSTIWTGSQPDITGPSTCNSGGCATNPVLPVTLVSFRARESGNGIDVEWTTASEINCAYFSVTKSYDGNNWNSIYETECSVKSDVIKEYKTTTEREQKEVYFRLAQIDIDGEITELGVVTVIPGKVHKDNGISLSPNPANSIVTVDFPEDILATVSLLDPYGRLVFHRRGSLQGSMDISVEGLPEGLYIVLVRPENGMGDYRRLIVRH